MKITPDEFSEAIKNGFRPAKHRLEGFAEACYDDCSFKQLSQPGDVSLDCKEWEITEKEANECIGQAIEKAMFELCEEWLSENRL